MIKEVEMKRMKEIEFNKLFFLISILLIIAACVPSKKNNGNSYFEGEIIYKNEFVTKISQIDTTELVRKLGTGATFSFKEGNHFETFSNASELASELYNRKANKLYIKEDQSDTLHWVDCSDDAGGKMLKFELHPKAEKVLGIECDELVTYYENKTVFDYFNPETLRVNPDWYSKYKLYNKDWKQRKMGALFLKHKVEFRTFVFSITATMIKEHHVNDSLFVVPKNKIMIKEKW
jgi:hypothetical protein